MLSSLQPGHRRRTILRHRYVIVVVESDVPNFGGCPNLSFRAKFGLPEGALIAISLVRSVASFKMQTRLSPSVCCAFLGCQIEKAVDELNLTKKIISCQPSNLPLPDHVDCFVALNRSPSCLEFSEALLGVHSTFDGSMILFENVVQVLHRSVSTAVAQRPFLFTVGDRGAVYRRQISVDHSRLGMESIAERLAKQPLGSIGVTQR